MKPTKNQLFERQITLSEIGEMGQEKIQKASVIIVGCGGLGSTIAVFLTSSGIGNIHLVDFDIVSISNLHRQVFYTLEDVGKSKVEILKNFIEKRAPYTKVTITNSKINKENAIHLIGKFDIVVDATDSLPTKYLLNDVCVLQGRPLVYGSLYKFDGYVATFNLKQKDGSFSTNLRDAFPKIATDIPNCEEAGTLNAIVGIIAMMQVNEVLKIATGVGNPISNELLIFNSITNSQLRMKFSSTFTKEKIVKIFENENYKDENCKVTITNFQISSAELKEKIGQENIEIIAVLPNLNLPFKVHQTIPISEFNPLKIDVDYNKTYVMICQKGFTSAKATQLLKEAYPTLNVLNLEGGIENYS